MSDDNGDAERSPAAGDKAPTRGWKLWLQRVGPWVIAVGVITLVLRKYSFTRIVSEVRQGHLLAMTPWAAALLTIGIVMVALADYMVIRGCIGRPSVGVVMRGKIGSTILNIVGYWGQVGGYGVWIARASGSSAGLASGIMLYIVASELCAVSLVACGSIWIGGADVPGAFRIAAPAIAGVLIFLKLLREKGAIRMEKLPRIFHPWRLMTRRQAMLQLLLRTVHIYWLVLCVWGGARAFGLEIPLTAMGTYLPIVLVVGSLPVNIGGFGAVQGAWLLLTPWARGEQLLAFSFVWQLLIALGVVVRGLPFIRNVVREIAAGRQTTESA